MEPKKHTKTSAFFIGMLIAYSVWMTVDRIQTQSENAGLERGYQLGMNAGYQQGRNATCMVKPI